MMMKVKKDEGKIKMFQRVKRIKQSFKVSLSLCLSLWKDLNKFCFLLSSAWIIETTSWNSSCSSFIFSLFILSLGHFTLLLASLFHHQLISFQHSIHSIIAIIRDTFFLFLAMFHFKLLFIFFVTLLTFQVWACTLSWKIFDLTHLNFE